MVVLCEFSVLLGSKPFGSSLSFGLGPSRIINFIYSGTKGKTSHNIFLICLLKQDLHQDATVFGPC